MNLAFCFLLLLGIGLPIVRSNVICLPDPCDSCNSQQVCNVDVCESTGGGGGNPCDDITCGEHAACSNGACHCNEGYQGNAYYGCSPVPKPTTPEPTTTTTTEKPTGPVTTPSPTRPPTPPPTTNGSTPVEKLLSRADWDALFPNRWHESTLWHQYYNPQQPWYYPEMEIDYYSYENFVGAVQVMADSGLGNFVNEPGTSEEERKRELCAFLGNVAHETGEGESGLFYREEIGYERTHGNWNGGYYNKGSRVDYVLGTEPVYFRPSTQLAGNLRFTHASYHGRGPLQLSHGYNYGDFSKAVFKDPQVLLENPDMLLDDPKLGISAAIWFWMTQPDWRMTHNPHKVMYKQTSSLQPWGFGRTIMAINGGLEGDSTENGWSEKDKKVTRRIKNYRRCAQYFNIPIGVDGEQLDTKGMWN